MPESSLTFEFSIGLPIQHSTRSVRCRCRRLAQPATLRSPKLSSKHASANPAPRNICHDSIHILTSSGTSTQLSQN
jgi:hypothetical protein